MDGAPELVHATAIAVGNAAALIRGAPGTGKSDLALRCLMFSASSLIPEAPRLVADDQVILTRVGGAVEARAPATILGKLEVRGIGIVAVPFTPGAEVRLVVVFAVLVILRRPVPPSRKEGGYFFVHGQNNGGSMSRHANSLYRYHR